MYIVIFKGASDEMYINSATCIAFSIQDTVIKYEEIDWIIHENFLLGSQPARSSPTLLIRYSDIIIFQEK